MNVLSLFSGIGGLELGLERAAMTVVGQVEIDPYCQRVLANHWPEVPKHDDVRTCVDWWQSEPRPRVDLICGGFPCQDISNAGRRAGIVEGTRSSLWSAMAGTVRALRPRYVLVENVAALLARGLDVVLADLAEGGYDAEWDCIPASAFGAPHRRDRLWLVAYPQCIGVRQQPVAESGSSRPSVTASDGSTRYVAHTSSDGRGAGRTGRSASQSPNGQGLATESMADTDRKPLVWPPVTRPERHPWRAEPDVGRVVDGIPARLVEEPLRALGNAVVPQVAEHVGRLILAADREQVAS